MATEILLALIKSHIDPLIACGGLYIDGNGLLINQETKEPLKYVNQKYNGEVDKAPYITLVVPCTDEHFLKIKENPAFEVFNPFVNIKHMLIVAVVFKSNLLAYHVTNKALEIANGDDSKLKDLIQFYNAEEPDGRIRVGFCNVEDPDNPVDIYTFVDEDIIKATWGLCVTAFNATNPGNKNMATFGDINKSWRKVVKGMELWDKERKHIFSEVKDDKLSSFSVEHMDLSDSASGTGEFYMPPTYKADDFIGEDDLDTYLTSMFNPKELVRVGHDGTEYEPETINTDMALEGSDLIIDGEEPEIEEEISEAEEQQIHFAALPTTEETYEDNFRIERHDAPASIKIALPECSKKEEDVQPEERPAFKIDRNNLQMNNPAFSYPFTPPMMGAMPGFPGMGMGFQPTPYPMNTMQQNMFMSGRVAGNGLGTTVASMDLTGGDIIDQYAAYR